MKFKNNKAIMLFVCAVTFTSCSIHQQYIAPTMEIPNQYPNINDSTLDSTPLSYDIFFKDHLLKEYLKTAFQKNQDIQVAFKTIEQLDLMYLQAKQNQVPNLDLNVNANRNWVSKNSLNGSLTEEFTNNKYLDDYNATLQLSWEADIWGKKKLLKEASRSAYFSQQDQLQALKTRIVVQVAQAYYHLIALDEKQKIALENVVLSKESLRILQLQYNSGKVDLLAIQQAEAQKKVVELILPQVQQQISVQENALSILLGKYPEEIKRASNLESIIADNELTIDVPAKLLSRRPDVRAAEHQVQSLHAKTGLTHIAMYPSISITPSMGVNSFAFSNWFNLPGSLIKTIGSNLAMPLLNKKQLKTQYHIALLEQEKATIEFQKTMMKAVTEVSDAMAKTAAASERIQLIKERTSFFNDAIITSTQLYKSGKISYIEVLYAQDKSLENQLKYVENMLEKAQNKVELFRALGGAINN